MCYLFYIYWAKSDCLFLFSRE